MAAGALNLLKLCVGVEEPRELAAWQVKRRRETGGDRPVHVTRMWPRRGTELLDGGSIYWVMKGLIRARQRIVALDEVSGADGISRCSIGLDPELILTELVPRRPFQGWRYLEGAVAPADLQHGGVGQTTALPHGLELALCEIGVR